MEYYTAYMLFALTTSLTALYELVYPVMRKQEQENGPIENKGLYYFIFLTLNTLVAPMVFLMCIIPSWGERFRASLQNSLFEQK